MRLPGAEKALIGAESGKRAFMDAGEAAADEVECISDVRGSAPYKRELVRVFVRRALHQALDDDGATQ
jgi:carbon-monoxide dehydrogenase medium subunit